MSNSGVLENSSKKRGRGRPLLIPVEQRATLNALYPEKGDRSLRDQVHQISAFTTLREVPEYRELFRIGDNSEKFRYSSVLTEIGRLGDKDLILVAAHWFADNRVLAREAIVAIRKWRLRLREVSP